MGRWCAASSIHLPLLLGVRLCILHYWNLLMRTVDEMVRDYKRRLLAERLRRMRRCDRCNRSEVDGETIRYCDDITEYLCDDHWDDHRLSGTCSTHTVLH